MVKGARVSVPGAFGFFAGNGRSALSVLGYAFCGLCVDPAPSYQAPGFSFPASQEMLLPPHFPRTFTFYLMVAHFLASGMEAARHAVEVQLFRFARNDFCLSKRVCSAPCLRDRAAGGRATPQHVPCPKFECPMCFARRTEC